MELLERADPVLYQHLQQNNAADCFFVYRMIIVQLRREMPIEQVRFSQSYGHLASGPWEVPYR